MCGIVGIASNQDCIQNIISGLKSLEYRGYDSCGISVIDRGKFKTITWQTEKPTLFLQSYDLQFVLYR